MRLLLTILLLGLPMLCSAGEVYKWRDKYGNIHYSDVEPANQKAQRKAVKAEKVKEPVATPAPLTEKEMNCATARRNLEKLADNKPVQMDVNNDGKPDVLTDEQRTQQKTAMQAAVDTYCTK